MSYTFGHMVILGTFNQQSFVDPGGCHCIAAIVGQEELKLSILMQNESSRSYSYSALLFHRLWVTRRTHSPFLLIFQLLDSSSSGNEIFIENKALLNYPKLSEEVEAVKSSSMV
ncbi:hypothetical protein P8452_57700 [Trifolium repens]|nr:hypothetical protein P8452_57700 [Trifolium repens]